MDIKFSGRLHIWDVPQSVSPAALKLYFVAQLFFSLASPLTKISILCSYRRLLSASSNQKTLKGLIIVTGVMNLGLSISYFFSVVFQCRFISPLFSPTKDKISIARFITIQQSRQSVIRFHAFLSVLVHSQLLSDGDWNLQYYHRLHSSRPAYSNGLETTTANRATYRRRFHPQYQLLRLHRRHHSHHLFKFIRSFL